MPGTELAQYPVKEPGMVQSSKGNDHVDVEMGQAWSQDKLAKCRRPGGIVQEYLAQSSKGNDNFTDYGPNLVYLFWLS